MHGGMVGYGIALARSDAKQVRLIGNKAFFLRWHGIGLAKASAGWDTTWRDKGREKQLARKGQARLVVKQGVGLEASVP